MHPKRVNAPKGVRCSFARMVAVDELKPHPSNPNTHPDEQVKLLAKILAHQGWRSPVVVSNRSGFVVAGHGRLLAAKLAGMKEVPVDFQDFATEEYEVSHLLADNRIAELAEMDGALLKELLTDLDTGAFDMELTGFTEMEMERVINSYHTDGVNDPNAEWQGMPAFEQADIEGAAFCCLVKFHLESDRDAFEALLGYKLQHKGKKYSTWFPKAEHDQLGKGMRYATGE